MILMTPGPSMISKRVSDVMQEPLVFHRSEPFKQLLVNAEDLLRKLFITDNDVLLLTGSGTLAVESMIYTLVDRDDRVLVLEDGEFGRRIHETLLSRGANVSAISAPAGKAVTFEDTRAALDSRKFEFLFMTYTETSTGVTNNDLEQICRYAKGRGIIICIDAISAIGGEPLFFHDWELDAVAGCSQKCVGAPPGLSFVALSSEASRKAAATREKPKYLDLNLYAEYLGKRETPFTPAVNLVRALNEALLEIFEDGGIQAKWARQRSLASMLYSGSEGLGIKCFVNNTRFRSNTLAAFSPPPEFTSQDIVRGLWEQGYVISAGMGDLRSSIFRVGVMGSIGENDVKGCLSALARVLGK